MASRNPRPASPSSAVGSTRTSLNTRSMQPRPRTPSESVARREMPGVSSGTRNALMPRARAPGSVAANTMATSATSALATQTFVPLMTQPRSSRRATVCWFAASDPALASDSANAPIGAAGRQRRQPARALRLAAELGQRLGDERVVDGQDDGERRARLRHGFDRHGVRQVVASRAAGLLRNRHAHQAERGRLGHQRARVFGRLVDPAPPPEPRDRCANARTVAR